MDITEEKNKRYQKHFGFLISFLLFLFTVYSYFKNYRINYWTTILCFSIILVSIYFPELLKYPSNIWKRIGNFLHFLISPIILFLVYVFSVAIIGMIIKIFKKDLLNKNFYKNKHSYWNDMKVEKKKINLDNQF